MCFPNVYIYPQTPINKHIYTEQTQYPQTKNEENSNVPRTHPQTTTEEGKSRASCAKRKLFCATEIMREVKQADIHIYGIWIVGI